MEKKVKKIPVISIAIIILVLVLAATAYYFYSEYNKIKQNPQYAAQQQNDAMLKSLGKLIVLPADETPTVAEVLDKEKLKDQAFFTDAQNGDKIIIYTKAQKAIIYRESENKIINVGPILINNTAQVSVVLQGSAEAMASAATAIASQLGTSVNVVNKIPSTKTYGKNLVVDIKGDKTDVANRLASTVSGVTGSLPEGETAPDNVDFLIFVK